MEWRIEELFQRDIDWSRVESSIVPYLKQDSRPQFFNALTIALLPYEEARISSYEDANWKPPKLEEEDNFEKTAEFGPISCGFWQDWNSIDQTTARLGQLCWNRQQVTAIAIDGQHRLAAIKRVVQGGHDAYAECAIPVIFVVLDRDLGYTGAGDRAGLVGTLRQLFIDLNKHAKVPSRGRQILLDDRDPASRCVRAAVGSRLRKGRAELDEDPRQLPLSLVDWHSEQAKFDEGPYVTTVLGLDWAIGKLLHLGPLHDMMNFGSISTAIRRIEQQLDLDLSSAKSRLEECERYERPFTFEDSELTRLGTAFSTTWASSLVELLTELKPYRELVDERSRLGTMTPEFANWYALKQKADSSKKAGKAGEATQLLQHFEQEISTRSTDPIAPADFRDALSKIDEIKAERDLAFTVVFQRALIAAYRAIIKVTDNMLTSADSEASDDIDELLSEEDEGDGEISDPGKTGGSRAKDLVEALNRVIDNEPGFLRRTWEFDWSGDGDFDRFWIGSFLHVEGNIDFTQSASVRGSDWLLLTGFMWLDIKGNGANDFDRWLQRIDNATSGLDLKTSQCVGRLMGTNNGVAVRILEAREQEASDYRRREEVLRRARALWTVLV